MTREVEELRQRVEELTSERERLELALSSSEARFRSMIDGSAEVVWQIGRDGTLRYVSHAIEPILGLAPHEVVGRSVLEWVVPEDRAHVKSRIDELLNSPPHGTVRSEFRVNHRDGSVHWLEATGTNRFDDPAIDALVGNARDITTRIRNAEARERLAQIVEFSDDAIFSTDLEGTITSWNRGAERLYGYEAAEIIGRGFTLLVPEERAHESTEILERARRGESLEHFETTRRCKDGSLVDIVLTCSPTRDAAGTLTGTSRIARDLTERRRAQASLRTAEEQLLHAQKLEAVGSLAGGVAHDFNNLLTVILSYTNLALGDLEPGEPLRADLEEVEKAAQRASSLTRQLLAFSRRQVLSPQVIDPNRLLGGLERMLARLIGEHITLTMLLEQDVGSVLADPGQLEQVVMNLAVNARDAMPQGGHLTIETRRADLDASYAEGHPDVTPGAFVMIAVTDSGTGMDAVTRSRIFEPFFTTKAAGQGTGLGLSTVYGIVKQSGGHVWVYSEPGEGTTFKIYLPRGDTDGAPLSIAPAEPVTLRGSETILLVEDDDHVRGAVRAILRRQGYHVLEAQNGGEALLICEQFRTKIHLLVTDVVMPRMNGKQLADRLCQLRPTLRVLFVSGYTENTIVHHGILDAGINYLQKPITPDALARKVREVLGQ